MPFERINRDFNRDLLDQMRRKYEDDQEEEREEPSFVAQMMSGALDRAKESAYDKIGSLASAPFRAADSLGAKAYQTGASLGKIASAPDAFSFGMAVHDAVGGSRPSPSPAPSTPAARTPAPPLPTEDRDGADEGFRQWMTGGREMPERDNMWETLMAPEAPPSSAPRSGEITLSDEDAKNPSLGYLGTFSGRTPERDAEIKAELEAEEKQRLMRTGRRYLERAGSRLSSLAGTPEENIAKAERYRTAGMDALQAAGLGFPPSKTSGKDPMYLAMAQKQMEQEALKDAVGFMKLQAPGMSDRDLETAARGALRRFENGTPYVDKNLLTQSVEYFQRMNPDPYTQAERVKALREAAGDFPTFSPEEERMMQDAISAGISQLGADTGRATGRRRQGEISSLMQTSQVPSFQAVAASQYGEAPEAALGLREDGQQIDLMEIAGGDPTFRFVLQDGTTATLAEIAAMATPPVVVDVAS